MIYGIDFGNCSSHAAAWNGQGTPSIVFNNIEGLSAFPAFLCFCEDDTVETGALAQQSLELIPERCVRYVKRQLEDREEAAYTAIDGTTYAATQLAAMLLGSIREEIERSFGDTHPKVGLAVPATYTTWEKTRMLKAAGQAGLEVVTLVSEPLAAVYAETYGQEPWDETVLLVDLGACSLKIAAVKLSAVRSGTDAPTQSVRVLAVGGDDSLGGDAWNEPLCEYVLNQIEDEYGLCRNDEILKESCLKAEKMKQHLRERPLARMLLHTDGALVRADVSRDTFVQITAHLAEKIGAYADTLLAGLGNPQIDQVWMLGGGTRIPGVYEVMECRFPGKIRVKEAHLLAKGAAIAAANAVSGGKTY